MRYAIVKSGTSQVRVTEGDTVKVLGTHSKPNFEVLFYSDGTKIYMDKDELKSVKITALVLGTGKSRKITVGRFKAKSRYDKTRGFREQFTNLVISKITFGDKEEAKTEKAPAAKKVAAKTVAKKAAPKAAAKKVTKKAVKK